MILHTYFSLPGGMWVEHFSVYLMLAAGLAPCPCRPLMFLVDGAFVNGEKICNRKIILELLE